MDIKCCSESRTLGGRTSPENWKGEGERGITIVSVLILKCQLNYCFCLKFTCLSFVSLICLFLCVYVYLQTHHT